MEYPNFRLDGKIAIVTGASKGIGVGVAKAMAHAGATVIVTARDLPALEAVAQDITDEGGKAYAVALDITNTAEIKTVFDKIHAQHGAIDILVNNAGLGFNHAALDVTEKDWDDMMAVNQKGLFFCCQAAGRHMLANGFGRVVNMSSQASVVGIKDHAVYCTSKGGVNQLTRVLALEWSASGVTVNAVGPTFTYTPGTAERLDNPEYLKEVLARIPSGKVATMTDVAAAVIYLASPAAGIVSGSVLMVDGGWTAQ